MITLLASNHPGSCYPSPPAQSKNGSSISGKKLLQLVAIDLHHVYDVHGWCLDDQNTKCSSQTMNLKFKAVLSKLESVKCKSGFYLFSN